MTDERECSTCGTAGCETCELASELLQERRAHRDELQRVERRVRAEVAEGRGKIVDEALMAARDDLVKTADRLRAKARETGDKTHFGTAAGVSLACLRLVELADRARTPDLMAALKAELAAAREAPKAKPVVAAAGSSPDTTPEGSR